MKNKIFRLLTFFIFISTSIIAADTESLLNRVISINIRNEPIEDALEIISDKGGFLFSYNSSIIDKNQLISKRIQNKTIENILYDILGDSYEFRQVGNSHIIIREAFTLTIRPMEDRKRLTPAEQERLKEDIPLIGKVLDEKTGKGIENVVVYDSRRKLLTLTDSTGYYRLDIPVEQLNEGVFFRGRGYYDTMVQFDPDKEAKFIKYNVNLTPYLDQPGPIDKDFTLTATNPHTLGLVQKLVPTKVDVISNNIEQVETRVFQFTFVPFLSNTNFLGGSYENRLSINTFVGYSAGVKGLEIGGFVNINRFNMRGMQVGGLVNIVGGNVNGFQVGGISNYNLGKVNGVNFGGILNVAKDTVLGIHVGGIADLTLKKTTGIQIGGIVSTSVEETNGIQIGGIYSYAEKFNGIQIGGITNTTIKNSNGMQMSGIYNYGQKLRGMQVAGISNTVTDTISGVQLAGIYNYAKNMNGVQIGLVNSAKRGKNAFPIGLFAWYDDGYHSAGIEVDETTWANFYFRSGSRKLYNYFQVKYNFGNEYHPEGIGVGYGFGTFLMKRLNFEAGAVFSMTTDYDDWTSFYVNTKIRYVQPIGKHFNILVGPTVNWSPEIDGRRMTVPPHLWKNEFESGPLWISANFGLQFTW
ncbi:hypothetical protein KMW28_14745 [Flammeovirga yaeyamensis]|uniref:Uncharacterized protein n=1 Tax=Flammeovirga yaeyamensis TaxID=367791 RepID=A0AAX1N055_9BACT|nr:hypothetical protein [Flammeovirga yaeyamensis]MBB3700149.1 hypothetical protein [Flammeovirga yaeyamensis]NMF37221.1 hypothetical protein [Flammeovirga yaeyamensis]QWG00910.1 hypothetical protein KMW28_14745 [Flammeovirga yaeyamensis]